MPDQMEMPEFEMPGQKKLLARTQALSRVVLGQLLDLANRNAYFREGRIDMTSFEICEGQTVVDADLLEIEESTTWSFAALRNPEAREITEGANYIFKLSRMVRQEGVAIPENIFDNAFGCEAVDDDGLEDEDPKLEGGDEADRANDNGDYEGPISGEYTRDHEVVFTVYTSDATIACCEGIAYIDEYGEKVHSVCSCPADGEDVLYSRAYDSEGGMTITDTLRQVTTDEFAQRVTHDVLTLGHPLAASLEWAYEARALPQLEAEIVLERKYTNWVWAAVVLQEAKDALQRQYG